MASAYNGFQLIKDKMNMTASSGNEAGEYLCVEDGDITFVYTSGSETVSMTVGQAFRSPAETVTVTIVTGKFHKGI